MKDLLQTSLDSLKADLEAVKAGVKSYVAAITDSAVPALQSREAAKNYSDAQVKQLCDDIYAAYSELNQLGN